MTASAQGLTPQGLFGSGIPSQQGTFTPGFPPPIGVEQYLGTTQQLGYPAQGWQQMPYGMQAPYGQFPWSTAQGQFGTQMPPGFGQPTAGQWPQQQIQQVVQQLLGQILPVAQQMILPQVIALAVQQIQQHVQQLTTLLAQQQLTGQQATGMPQAPTAMAGQFTRPYPAFF